MNNISPCKNIIPHYGCILTVRHIIISSYQHQIQKFKMLSLSTAKMNQSRVSLLKDYQMIILCFKTETGEWIFSATNPEIQGYFVPRTNKLLFSHLVHVWGK